MQILNLIDNNKGDIKYSIFRFPDGEAQIKLEEFSHKDKIQVVCRITNAEELFIVSQVIDILNRHEVIYDLFITYLMGMRMDRVMDFNRPFTLKVIANILSNAKAISILEVHSDITSTLLNANIVSHSWSQLLCHYQIIFPDEGAKNRYKHKVIPPVITCNKVRDLESGKILGIKIDNPISIAGDPLLIYDDLCDGGGTFCGIAKELNKLGIPKSRLNVAVTHMVNRKGIENLSANFNHVWFTNSYKDWDNLPENVTMINVI